MLAHLQEVYGHSEFRSSQQEIISSLLAHDSVVAIMPTGGGKSLLYQFVATYTGKTCVVVSPLISLMNDQAMSLHKLGISAVCLNSETKLEEKRKASTARIIYTTPEHIVSESCPLWTMSINIGLFAIDEAHCISQWSHDFRPAYRSLAKLSVLRPDVPVLAVTATATPLVLAELRSVMQIDDCKVFQEGTHRDNLRIKVCSKSEFDKCDFTKPTIVYVQTRKICESIGQRLTQLGHKTAIYHGGLPKAVKSRAHTQFASGLVQVVVATISFGMGIDKGDVGHVVNYGVPNDIETYYQEIGRAGRDGSESYATIYYDLSDFTTAHRLIGTCACHKQRKIKQAALRQLRSYLAEGERCRQGMIDSYFKHGDVGQANTLAACKICDNCLRTGSRRGKNIAPQLCAIWRIVGIQKSSSGFGTGILKTVKKLSTDAAFSGFGKLRIRACVEEAITKNIIVQREVRMKGGRLVLVLEQGPVRPTVSVANCLSPQKSGQSVATAVRQALQTYRRDAARSSHLPEDLIMSDGIIQRICSSVEEYTPCVKKDDVQGLAPRRQREVGLIVSRTVEEARTARRTHLLNMYSNDSSLAQAELGNADGVGNEIVDILEADSSLPLYLDFFGLSKGIEDRVKVVMSSQSKASSAFVAKKSGEDVKEYHVRLVKLVHAA